MCPAMLENHFETFFLSFFHCARSLVRPVGSSPPTRDQTWASLPWECGVSAAAPAGNSQRTPSQLEQSIFGLLCFTCTQGRSLFVTQSGSRPPEPPALAGLTSLVRAARARVRAVVMGTYVDPCQAQGRGPPSSPLQVASRAG